MSTMINKLYDKSFGIDKEKCIKQLDKFPELSFTKFKNQNEFFQHYIDENINISRGDIRSMRTLNEEGVRVGFFKMFDNPASDIGNHVKYTNTFCNNMNTFIETADPLPERVRKMNRHRSKILYLFVMPNKKCYEYVFAGIFEYSHSEGTSDYFTRISK